ncbi:exocyst complex component 3-like protein isoform X1 [Alligator sinensis]|uniref:Exocyst complex component 3-like protein n=1 Tax=Alligator sinensis TaxID=38654 RepID=A0A1U7RYN5_ALLSI|nr:exocyst complex component 3-like protein isoform X1 [Alligator sinensis]
MGMSAEEEDSSSPKDEEWPEVEKAEKLARGAALKWASGVFYHPDKLEGLGHYWRRETQRNNSIQSRLKSTVQSYLEGVSAGLEQLCMATDEVQSVCQDLGTVQWNLLGSAECFQNLEQLRAVVTDHVQLGLVVQSLPQLVSVHELLSQTLHLLHDQHLLEAHAGLMVLERLRDNTLSQLHHSDLLNAQDLDIVESYFSGLQKVNEELTRQLWNIIGRSMKLVHEDPALFVSAVRIIEREENIDALFLDTRSHHFLPPGRPKSWRQKFYQVLQETITVAHFQASHADMKGPGMARHLAALQSNILAELCVVKDLMVQCCPVHYNIVNVCTIMYHQGLSSHLQDILSWDLDKQEIFIVLDWVLHVYHSPEMMSHPDLLPEVDVSTLGPLVPPEVVDHMERKYVVKVRGNMTEWMQRTLEVEYKEWFREEEPEMDHQGFFQSALPVIIMQMLNENIRVASLITDSLQQKVYTMAMDELETFLARLREALVEYGKEHQRDRAKPKYYVPYLLAVLNNNMVLSSSICSLHPNGDLLSEPREIPTSLKAALDRTQKKACQLLLEELLVDLQPLYMQLPSRKWLSGSQLVNSTCEVIDKYVRDFARVRKPIFKLLLSESEHLVMSQYLRALMQKKLVCKSEEERSQFSHRLLQDATQLGDLFHSLGLDKSEQTIEVIVALQELIRLKDPALLSLEVLGFVTKYPDISDEHVSALLDLRGDVSKEVRNMVMEMMAQNPQALPENYQPIFSNILVPGPELPFCLRKGKCA